MARKPSQKKTDQPVLDKFRVKSADVVITRRGERETLQIDGKVVEFYRTEGGYRLKTDVFQKPAKTLREATERYLESELQQ